MVDKMLKVENIRNQFLSLYEQEKFVTDKLGGKVIELLGQSFIADEPAIFGEPNLGYINREIEWYLSQSLKVEDISGKTPEIWNTISSKNGEINSNYGYLIFSEQNGSQFVNVLKKLEDNPDTRQATMIYNRPSMHDDATRDGMSDFICTNAVNYFIRDNKISCVVQMRSNDCWAGYRNDLAWQENVLINLAIYLKIPAGEIYWNAASLHVYERQFWMIDAYIKTGNPCLTKEEYRRFSN